MEFQGGRWYDPDSSLWVGEPATGHAVGTVNPFGGRYEKPESDVQQQLPPEEPDWTDWVIANFFPQGHLGYRAFTTGVNYLSGQVSSAYDSFADSTLAPALQANPWIADGLAAVDPTQIILGDSLMGIEARNITLTAQTRAIQSQHGWQQQSYSSAFVQVGQAAVEGVGDGAAITANAWTFGLIAPMNNYVQYLKATNGGLYYAADFAAGVGRDVALAVLTSGGSLSFSISMRGAGAAVGMATNVAMVAATSGDHTTGWDYASAVVGGGVSGAANPYGAIGSGIGAGLGYGISRLAGQDHRTATNWMMFGNMLGGMGGSFTTGFKNPNGTSSWLGLGSGFKAGSKMLMFDVAGAGVGATIGGLSSGTWEGALHGAQTGQGVASMVGMGMGWLRNACFVAGTPLLTAEGARPIEAFRPGDRLLSKPEFNPEGAVQEREVLHVLQSHDSILEVHVGGRVIQSTHEHPFWVRGKGWTAANKLQAGDELSSHDGQWIVVDAVVDNGEAADVYNIAVSDYHTYFVGGEDWGFSVWAHNACTAEDVRRATGTTLDDAKLNKAVEHLNNRSTRNALKELKRLGVDVDSVEARKLIAENSRFVNPRGERPRHSDAQVQKVWDAAKEPTGPNKGKVFDRSKDTPVELTWDKTKNRHPQWQMGHRRNATYEMLHKDFMSGVISYQEFLRANRNPANYFPMPKWSTSRCRSPFAGQGFAAVTGLGAFLTFGIFFADDHRQASIVAELVMVDEIFIAQAEAINALFDEVFEGMLDAVGVTMVGKTAGKLAEEAELIFDLAKQQSAGVGGDVPAGEGGEDIAASQGLEKQRVVVTLCHSKGPS
jgi:hypothetical protein